LTVVLRFDFRSASDYYDRESVAPGLHRVRTPSLVVAARHDPIVPAESIIPADVLETYEHPYDATQPVICLD
jgi:predicted alpha/beta-fold hydrolase